MRASKKYDLDDLVHIAADWTDIYPHEFCRIIPFTLYCQREEICDKQHRISLWGLSQEKHPVEYEELTVFSPYQRIQYAAAWYFRNVWTPLSRTKIPQLYLQIVFDFACETSLAIAIQLYSQTGSVGILTLQRAIVEDLYSPLNSTALPADIRPSRAIACTRFLGLLPDISLT